MQAARQLPAPTPPGSNFLTLVLLGALAMISLPHQFHLAVVECRDPRDVRARAASALFVADQCFLLPLSWSGQLLLAQTRSRAILRARAAAALGRRAAGDPRLPRRSQCGNRHGGDELTLSIMVGNHWLTPPRSRVGGDLRNRSCGSGAR
jgi:hypothetical protein